MKFPSIGFEPFFSWVNRTRILYAPSVRKELAFELSQLGGSNVVLFTDKGVSKAGISQKIVEQISNSELKLAGIFDNIQQDARMTNINDGAEYYRSCGADCMVVVGGGSVMDTAKA
ncbi:MAG: iron-containing alcohol dehydrogenase, partial [Syntrophaceae bacterium]|nr:iron-containing alcohol dehydrogenase [Syntrophaceae bacterium]